MFAMDIPKEQTFQAIGEMVHSAHRVMGPEFANTVGALFALLGMEELSKRLVAAVRGAEGYLTPMGAMRQSVADQLLSLLPEHQRAEAMQHATRMIAKQSALHDAMHRSI